MISHPRPPVVLVLFCAVLLVAPVGVKSVDVLNASWESWRTNTTGRYAQLRTNHSARTHTVWSNGVQTQAAPVYSDVHWVGYAGSDELIYVEAPGLPGYPMGPWYLDPDEREVFPNLPLAQDYVAGFPRYPARISTLLTRSNTPVDIVGMFVNGLAMFNVLDGHYYRRPAGEADWNKGDDVAGLRDWGTGVWHRNAYPTESATFDVNLSHQSEDGEIHLHVNPVGLRAQLGDNVLTVASPVTYEVLEIREDSHPVGHSPIVGWAFDGFPVYGPYGYSVATNSRSSIRRMVSGYVLRDGRYGTSNLNHTGRTSLPAWAVTVQGRATPVLSAAERGPDTDRPAVGPDFPYTLGRYAEDYDYLGDLPASARPGVEWDLDACNQRWCVTPEFPEGIWAYFVTIRSNGVPEFPFLLGPQYCGVVNGGKARGLPGAVTTYFDIARAVQTHACLEPGGDLVSWWRGEVDARDSLGDHHGSLQGGATVGPGFAGQGFLLDGVDDRIVIPHGGELASTKAFTVETWVKVARTQFSADRRFVIADQTDGTASGWTLRSDAGQRAQFGIGVGSTFPLVTGTTVLTDDAWHHLAGVYDGTTLELYLDGRLEASLAVTEDPVASVQPLVLGGSAAATSPGRFLRGAIDEFGFHRRALGSAEIAALVAAGPGGRCADRPYLRTRVLADGVVTHAYARAMVAGLTPGPYQFTVVRGGLPEGLGLSLDGEITGIPAKEGVTTFAIRATDALGHASEVEYQLRVAGCGSLPAGLVAWWPGEGDGRDALGVHATEIPAGAGFGEGRVGRAFEFRGGAGLAIPRGSTFSYGPGSAMSFEMWLWREGQGGQHILGKRPGCADEINYQLIFDGRRLGWQNAVAADVLPMREWTHVAGTSDGQTFELFVNGERVASARGSWGPENDAPLVLGASGTCAGFLGRIDEPAFYSRVLGLEELKRLYQASAGGKCRDSLRFGPSAPEVGQVGIPYRHRFGAGVSPGPYRFALIRGSVPPGLELLSDGTLAGTPVEAGTWVLGIRVSDPAGRSAEDEFAVSIRPGVSVPDPVAWWSAESNAWDNLGGFPGLLGQPARFAPGVVGQAFSFDGRNGVQINHGGRFNFGPHQPASIEFWLFLDSAGAGEGIVGQRPGCGDEINHQFVVTGGVLGWWNAVAPVARARWTHVVGTYDGTVRRLYVDGVAQGADSTPFGIAGNAPLVLGGSGSCGGFVGLLDEVAVYDRALSADEIRVSRANPGAKGLYVATPSPLPGGAVCQPYQIALEARQGTPPYVFGVVEGSLPAGLALGGDGRLTGVPAAAGRSRLTLRVSDAIGRTATRDLEIEVAESAHRNPPTIGAVADQVLEAAGGTLSLRVTIDDADDPPESLKLTAASADPVLVPAENIVLGGVGSVRTVSITPVAGASGVVHVTLRVTDPCGSEAVTSFRVSIATPAPGRFTAGERALVESSAPRVTLDRVVYEAGHTLSARVDYRSAVQRQASPAELLVVSTETLDFERVALADGAEPTLRTTPEPLVLRVGEQDSEPSRLDGALQAKPGEVVMAFATYRIDDPGFPSAEMLGGDFGIVYDPAFSRSPVSTVAGIALEADESQAAVHGKSLATLAVTEPESYAIGQAAVDELRFAPRSADELARFLRMTGGTVTEGGGSERFPRWVTVRVTAPDSGVRYLPQLRDLYGDGATLLASRGEALSLYALGLQLRLDGFQVAMNPRFRTMGDAAGREDWRHDEYDGFDDDPFDGGNLTASFYNPVFGLRELWAELALWDRDLSRDWARDHVRTNVSVAILDMGFAENEDWRGYDAGWVLERDMASGTTGSGAALCDPTVGGTLFGVAGWHGTAVVSVTGGMLNNGSGTAGTGGQVALPMLYCMREVTTYASRISEAIRRAVDDGAEVVNLSAGYPCRYLLVLGTEDACTASGRAELLLRLTALSSGICSLAGAHPSLATLCTYYSSVEAFFTAFLAAETRGEMEDAIAFAKNNGVPVVTVSGNRLTEADLPLALRPYVTAAALANADLDLWQIIPGVIPDAITVAAAFPFGVWYSSADPETLLYDYYRNEHFYGDSVDVWAPIDSGFYSPEYYDTSATARLNASFQTDFGGTSAAAPYVSGLIADLMAVNPTLHRDRASASERATIVDRIAALLVDTAYLPGVPEADGTVVLPLSSNVLANVTPSVAAAMDLRRNLVHPYRAWRAAATGWIPDASALGFDTDSGHLSDGSRSRVGGGDDLGDRTSAATTLVAASAAPFGSVTDEIHFIWPEAPYGLAQVDYDHFQVWMPALADPTKMVRQEIRVAVPNYPKSLPWLSYWHGARVGAGTATNVYTFHTPWMAPPALFHAFVAVPQFTDTPFRIELTAYEEAPRPVADSFDTPPASNDTPGTAADPGGAGWKELTGPFPAEWFESKAWEANIPGLSLDRVGDVDWYRLEPPAAAAGDLTADCAPILWIRVLPHDPNLRVIVLDPVTSTIIKEGRGSDPLPLYRSDYGTGWTTRALLVGVQSYSETLHEYALGLRLSVPTPTLCCCWQGIVRSDYGPSDPIDLPDLSVCLAGSPVEPEFTLLDGSRVFPDEPLPGYASAPTLIDGEGRSRTPRTFLVRHARTGPFRVSAFLGHDQDFRGADQSLRLDLFSVANCQWLAGTITRGGVKQVLYDSATTPPVAPAYEIGDLDLYVDDLAEGIYLLTTSYFREHDGLDLVLGETGIQDRSPSAENAYDGSGSPEVILGPDAEVTAYFPTRSVFHPHASPPSVTTAAGGVATWVEFTGAVGRLYWVETAGADGTYRRSSAKLAGDGRTLRIPIDSEARASARVRSDDGQLAGVKWASSFRFVFSPDRGATYAVESSVDLVAWAPEREVVGDRETVTVELPLTSAYRFVRARRLDP